MKVFWRQLSEEPTHPPHPQTPPTPSKVYTANGSTSVILPRTCICVCVLEYCVLHDQPLLNTNYLILSTDALSIGSLQYKHSLWLFFSFVDAIIIIPARPPRRETEPRPGPDQAGGRKHGRTAAPGPGKCTQVIFVRRDQKAFTFRCFPDMNIQHPYWNLIWVSFSQGSFHQCLLPEATADWQPNFSEEQAGGGRGKKEVGGRYLVAVEM